MTSLNSLYLLHYTKGYVNNPAYVSDLWGKLIIKDIA